MLGRRGQFEGVADWLPVLLLWLGLMVSGRLALVLHLSDEPSELLEWLCHDDSTADIVMATTVTMLLHVHVLCCGCISMHRTRIASSAQC